MAELDTVVARAPKLPDTVATPGQQQTTEPTPAPTTDVPQATPPGALATARPESTTLSRESATELKQTFDKLDAVLAKYGVPKPVDHFARVQQAHAVLTKLASNPAAQKAFLRKMAQAGAAHGINCGLSELGTRTPTALNAAVVGTLSGPAAAAQKELTNVFGAQQQAQQAQPGTTRNPPPNQAQPSTTGDTPPNQAQTTQTSSDQPVTDPKAQAEAVTAAIFQLLNVDPKSGSITLELIDKKLQTPIAADAKKVLAVLKENFANIAGEDKQATAPELLQYLQQQNPQTTRPDQTPQPSNQAA
jgi:hypothetical protein